MQAQHCQWEPRRKLCKPKCCIQCAVSGGGGGGLSQNRKLLSLLMQISHRLLPLALK